MAVPLPRRDGAADCARAMLTPRARVGESLREEDSMRYLSPGRLLGSVGAIAVALVTIGGGFISPVLAKPAAAAGPVATKPAAGTPQLVRTSGVENIRQLVQCGTIMYAVGSFTEISQGGKNYSRNNVFSFSATAPYAVSGWNVNVNGDVNSIAFTSGNGCADAYIGGSF